MIAKISTGSYTYGAVNYNHSKTKPNKKGEIEGAILEVSNIENKSFQEIVSAIDDMNSKNKNVEKPVIHISLSFHKDDVLDDRAMVDIAKDYLENLGYKDQPYAIYRHFDKEHPHIHIVSSQIDDEGKKINDSHIYYRSQAITRELELKYNITVANEKNEVFSKKDVHTAIHEHLELGKHSLSAIMKRVLEDVLAKKPTSDKQLDFYLEDYQMKRNLKEDENKNIIGNYFDIYPLEYFNDSSKVKHSQGLKGSELSYLYSYQSIQSQIESNLKEKKAIQSNVMGKIYSVLKPVIQFEKSRSLEQNTDLHKTLLSTVIVDLKKKGINLTTKRAQTGDNINSIFGLIFQDIKSGHTFTASEIKLKTKDFLDTIFDDLKNSTNEERVKAESSSEDTEVPANFRLDESIKEDPFTAIDFLLGVLGGKALGSSGQDIPSDDPKKKKKKKRRGI